MFRKIKKLRELISTLGQTQIFTEEQKILTAKLHIDKMKKIDKIDQLEEVEFKVFSQWGDDGIIQWLIHHLDIPNKTFIEFGVGDYRESNTRFLMMNNNWSGLVMDGSKKNITKIINSEYYWKYELTARQAFITCENINNLISGQNFDEEVGLLHIDIDGNDYWIWKEINTINPIIVIMEYNSLFGIERPITIPYSPDFYRTNAHHSNLYFGASLKALLHLAQQKGYVFIGCNSAGNNAFFIRKDKINEKVREISPEKGYVLLKSRESRDERGNLTYATGISRLEIISGLPVIDVITGKMEKL
jgi:hypothetical protein